MELPIQLTTMKKTKHIIDTDILPTLPDWATIVENKTYGKIQWNLKDMELYLSEKQKDGYISGGDLRKEVSDKYPVNLAILQYLVDNPSLVPKGLEGKYVYGFGTIVEDRDGRLICPCLLVYDGRVVLGWDWLGYDWRGISPALRFASMDIRTSKIGTIEPRSLEIADHIQAVKKAGYQVSKIL